MRKDARDTFVALPWSELTTNVTVKAQIEIGLENIGTATATEITVLCSAGPGIRISGPLWTQVRVDGEPKLWFRPVALYPSNAYSLPPIEFEFPPDLIIGMSSPPLAPFDLNIQAQSADGLITTANTQIFICNTNKTPKVFKKSVFLAYLRTNTMSDPLGNILASLIDGTNSLPTKAKGF